jgi:hypothetical protein
MEMKHATDGLISNQTLEKTISDLKSKLDVKENKRKWNIILRNCVTSAKAVFTHNGHARKRQRWQRNRRNI